jgi:hypothetical protein
VTRCENCGAPFNEKMSKAIAPGSNYYLGIAAVYAVEFIVLLFILITVYMSVENSKILEERQSKSDLEVTPARSPSPTQRASPYRR